MTLSFAERRSQTRSLNNVSFWLNPQSHSFGSSSPRATTIEDFEKLCGPIQDARFDANLAKDMLNSALNMAEGLLVEYATMKNYKVPDVKLRVDYSLVSSLPDGDPGKELDLTLVVLQSIIKGNEAISSRADITERLEKLVELKADLDKDEPATPEFLSIEKRIDYSVCDETDEQRIQEFIDQTEKEKMYQYNVPPFAKSPYLLKGLKDVQFLQRAFASTSTVNKAFYDALFSAMESVVSRLSEEELETALTTASAEHFTRVKGVAREYVTDLKTALNCEKSGMVFTARYLLTGSTKIFADLNTMLTKHKNKHGLDMRNPYAQKHLGIKQICVDMFNDLPAPLYKILFETERPQLLMHLFAGNSIFARENFDIPVDLLMASDVFPLHKLLQMWLKRSDAFKSHCAKLLNCPALRPAVERLMMDEIEETVQPLVSCMAVVAGLGLQAKDTMTGDILRTLKRKSADAKSPELEWLVKYESGDKVAEWVGLIKNKPEEVIIDPSVWVTENDYAEEVKVEDTQKAGEESDDEREMRADELDQTQSEDEGVETEEEEGEKKKETAEEEKEKKETYQAPEDLADAVARGIVNQLVINVADDAVTKEEENAADEKVPQDLVDDAVTKEENGDSEKVPQDLVDGAVAKEESVSSEQVSQEPTGDTAVKEDDAAIDQMPHDPSAPPSIADEEEIYPDQQEGLLLHDEPAPEGAVLEQNEMEEEEGEERLAASQSATNSQDVDGFSRSIDQI